MAYIAKAIRSIGNTFIPHSGLWVNNNLVHLTTNNFYRSIITKDEPHYVGLGDKMTKKEKKYNWKHYNKIYVPNIHLDDIHRYSEAYDKLITKGDIEYSITNNNCFHFTNKLYDLVVNDPKVDIDGYNAHVSTILKDHNDDLLNKLILKYGKE